MYYKITPEQLEQVLNDLSSRPWALVNNVIVTLSKLEKVDEKNEDKKEENSTKH